MMGLGHARMPHAADWSLLSDHVTVFGGLGLTLLFDGMIGTVIAVGRTR